MGPFTPGRAYHGMKRIQTERDVWRHVARRVAVATGCTVILTVTGLLVTFGWDMTAQISLLSVIIVSVPVGIIIAVSITATLAYRSTVVVRELQVTRGQLLQISRTDPLTGLLNRRGYDEAALAILAVAGRRDNPAVVLMCDIDHFKAINDGFGHDFGDDVLVEIGKVIRSFGEEHGVLTARHGGEEFAVMMAGISEVQGVQLANELRQRCAALRIAHSEEVVSVTVSIGLAAARQPTTVSVLMKAADAALYSAKRRGRNRVERTGEGTALSAVA